MVDANDRVVGRAPRSEVRRRGLIHRVTYILVLNSAGRLLLQKRTRSKDLYPGFYDAAAGGVVLDGEAYQASAERELHEELGIQTPLHEHFDHYFDDGHNRYWGRVFSCRSEGPFVLQVSEIESAQFVEIERVLDQSFSPLTPDTFEVLQEWCAVQDRK